MKKISLLLILTMSLLNAVESNTNTVETNNDICQPYLNEVDKLLEIAKGTLSKSSQEFGGLLASQTAIIYQLKYNDCRNEVRYNNTKKLNNEIKKNKQTYKEKSDLIKNVF